MYIKIYRKISYIFTHLYTCICVFIYTFISKDKIHTCIHKHRVHHIHVDLKLCIDLSILTDRIYPKYS